MYESKHETPLPRYRFALRLLLHIGWAMSLLVVSLGMGVAGYWWFEGLPFVDGLLNSAMLLGGMGPVNAPVTTGGKLFASFYALYAGLGFIVAAALILTPVLHRILHRFHWNQRR